MRVPPFDRYRRWLAGFGLFLAGMVVGSAVYMSLHHHSVSLLAVRNATLQSELKAAQEDLKSIVNTRNLQSRIGTVKVIVDPAPSKEELDELSELELRDRVHRDLLVAAGKPVSSIRAAPQVFARLVDGKVYHGIREKNYRVSVRTLFVVGPELTVWLTAEEYLQP